MKKVYVQIWGGLGDVALTTPVFQAFKTKYPSIKTIALCRNHRDMQLLQNNPYIDSLKLLTFFWHNWYVLLHKVGLIKIHIGNYGGLNPSYTYEKRATEIIAEMMDLQLHDANVQIYLDNEEDRTALNTLSKCRNPVIIHITSIASRNQMWPIEKWNELVQKMPDYTFIQLGLPNEEKVEGAIDMRGKTSVRESVGLIKHALGFVGVVSFFAHVTNAFNKPGVVFYGPSSKSVWGHPNNINISKDLPCLNCIDWLSSIPCPYGKPCMELITVQEVEAALIQQTTSYKQPIEIRQAEFELDS